MEIFSDIIQWMHCCSGLFLQNLDYFWVRQFNSTPLKIFRKTHSIPVWGSQIEFDPSIERDNRETRSTPLLMLTQQKKAKRAFQGRKGRARLTICPTGLSNCILRPKGDGLCFFLSADQNPFSYHLSFV